MFRDRPLKPQNLGIPNMIDCDAEPECGIPAGEVCGLQIRRRMVWGLNRL